MLALKKSALFVTCAVFFGTIAGASVSWGDDKDAAAVRQVLVGVYDKPEARLAVEPVVIEGDVAIADWSQGDMGGRALLRRKDGAWSIALCAGDALKQSATLEKLGMSRRSAETLANNLVSAERALPAETLARFSRFDAMIAVDAAGGHAPADPYHKVLP